ncbi:MAG: UDP-N-acetylglucosamine 1-carboxyvinyltransferase [Puniceicoccales bacterium]|jgi:UDP-N-acetylglucosamine 1-carboxyvinyltransferase|nr:UDP-N-acetylglucosamine 1-carboxyvinyltransferase [Puniceicoccales bacterium]
MQYTKIVGGNGLEGEVPISGSKNACLPIIAATLLTHETCILHNVPDLTDTSHMLEIIRYLGSKVQRLEKNSWSITAQQVNYQAPRESAGRLRASVCLMGALLGRKKQAIVPIPGGCNLGARPIDLHLRAFETMGVTIKMQEEQVYLSAKNLRGTTLSMEGPRGSTVTGTANLIMAAVLAEGITTIQQASKEPEIGDLCHFLVQMGTKIHGIGTETLTIEGVDTLYGTEFTIQPDRMEAGTFIILGLLCGNSIAVTGTQRIFLQSALCGLFDAIPHMGEYCHWENDTLHVSHAEKMPPFSIQTRPYPGFPTDLQPQITVLASQIVGTSYICDTIFPERFAHVTEFKKFGMHIEQRTGAIYVHGRTKLQGTSVQAMDLRAGGALYLAGLTAHGETTIRGVEYVDRGYEHFETKLRALGATIERMEA